MVPTISGRIRRLIVTAVIAAGLGGSVAGVALASTGGTASPSTSTRTATTSTSSSSTPSSPARTPSGAPSPGSAGAHHCTHMKGVPSSRSPAS
jgi:hypothetical protein